MFEWYLFFSVLDPLSFLYAILTGFATGSTALLYGSLRYPFGVSLRPFTYASITTLSALVVGAIFFAGQMTQAFISDDDSWERILGRFLLWCVYSVSLGSGLAFARSFAHRTNRL